MKSQSSGGGFACCKVWRNWLSVQEMDRPPEGGDGAEAEGLRASVVQLFQEDIVQSLANPGRIGMVTRVGGDSSDSDSSDSEDEAEDDHDRTLAEGSARIVWIDSQESVEKVADLQVVDRAFMHGDIVALASDPLGQTGTVMDVDMAVDLETSNKEVVKNIDSRLLRRVHLFLSAWSFSLSFTLLVCSSVTFPRS